MPLPLLILLCSLACVPAIIATGLVVNLVANNITRTKADVNGTNYSPKARR